MLQYPTLRLYFCAFCLLMKANKFFLVAIAVFFASNSWRTNFDISSCTQRFYSKEVVVLSLRRPTFRILRSTGERYRADVWGNRLPLPPKAKYNFSGIDISQPTPSMSLSVPSFSLDQEGLVTTRFKKARAVWKLRALKFNMAVAMNFFIPNVEEFFETILSLFNQSNGCLELRDGDQAEFLSRRLEQYEQTLRVMYQRLTETSGNNCLSAFISCSTSCLIASWRGHVSVRC